MTYCSMQNKSKSSTFKLHILRPSLIKELTIATFYTIITTELFKKFRKSGEKYFEALQKRTIKVKGRGHIKHN